MKQVKKNRQVGGLFAVSAFLFSLSSICHAKELQIEGKVVEKSDKHLVIEAKGENKPEYLFFDKKDAAEFPQDLKVGDQVSVKYVLKLQKATLQKKEPSQKPGQIPPNKLKPQLDDRIFYEASNSSGNSCTNAKELS